MTALALLAVLPAGAGRYLSEPGTIPVPADGLLGLCVPAPDFSTVDGAQAAVAAQHALLTRVALAHDLVPVRHGAVFSTRARVAAHLAAARDDLGARLGRIAGCLELVISVRATPERPAPVSATGDDGLAYLRARRPRAAGPATSGVGTGALAAIVAEVQAAGAPGVLARDAPSADPGLAAVTLLVPRERIASVLSALRVANASRALEVTVQGPWPCYTFSTAEVSHAAP